MNVYMYVHTHDSTFLEGYMILQLYGEDGTIALAILEIPPAAGLRLLRGPLKGLQKGMEISWSEVGLVHTTIRRPNKGQLKEFRKPVA